MPADIFAPQLTGLSGQFRVLAFDPRSQGASDAYLGRHTPERRCKDIQELLAHAKPTHTVLAGWSLGVLEVLDYLARNRPKELSGLILIDNSIGMGPPPPSSVSPSKTQPLAPPDQRAASLRAFVRSLTNKRLSPGLFETIFASTLKTPELAARELVNKPYPREYWRDTLLRQSVPVLYAIRPRYEIQARELLSRMPGRAHVAVFPDAGHALFLDQTQRFNQVAAAFAEKTFQQRSPASPSHPK